jgi:hypothetical protein
MDMLDILLDIMEAGSTTDTEAGLIMEDIMEGTAAVMVVATAGAPIASAVSNDTAACGEESVGLCGASILYG